MFKNTKTLRTAVTTLAAGALSLGLLTTATGTAQAALVCDGTVSVYGVLADGRLTFSSINPENGNRIKTLIGPDLGFTPKALTALNFNTLLVTSNQGALYRVDVKTNNTTLELADTNPVTRIEASGWTHDKLTYDGFGHLYGTTAAGTLLQYPVTASKPASIAAGKTISEGFVLNTLTSAGKDTIVGTSADGKLLSYKIIGTKWTRQDLRTSAWGGFEQLVTPGGGLYYGVTASKGMYWYKDTNPLNNSGGDIVDHNDDPVDTSGWSQVSLSAVPKTYSCSSESTLGQRIAERAEAEVGSNFGDYDFDHSRAWCAEFGDYIWSSAGVSGTSQLNAAAISFRSYGLTHGTYRTGAPKVGDAALYDTDHSLTDGEANHINLVVEVSADGKQIRTVGGNESGAVQKSGWFNWDTAASPIGAGPVLAFISPVD
ncbi:CHAP domain-containing protein [Streptomyces sp. NPDC047853]|uniref:CHAP domain-containing protein n=1 Tax=unclassified Streptomyces TaxID=2593676 RepID=UPI00345676B5